MLILFELIFYNFLLGFYHRIRIIYDFENVNKMLTIAKLCPLLISLRFFAVK